MKYSDFSIEESRRRLVETATKDSTPKRYAGLMCDRAECIKRFGRPAVRFYEDEIRRLDEDDERRDDPYKWIFKTAAEDRKNYEGFYKNAVRRIGRAKRGK